MIGERLLRLGVVLNRRRALNTSSQPASSRAYLSCEISKAEVQDVHRHVRLAQLDFLLWNKFANASFFDVNEYVAEHIDLALDPRYVVRDLYLAYHFYKPLARLFKLLFLLRLKTETIEDPLHHLAICAKPNYSGASR